MSYLKKLRTLERLKKKCNLQDEYEKIIHKKSTCSKYERDLIVQMFEYEATKELLENFKQREISE